jgi:hypothetical protein
MQARSRAGCAAFVSLGCGGWPRETEIEIRVRRSCGPIDRWARVSLGSAELFFIRVQPIRPGRVDANTRVWLVTAGGRTAWCSSAWQRQQENNEDAAQHASYFRERP